MTESELYESLGRKQAELDTLNLEYSRLLDLLRLVVIGEITHDRVTVEMDGRKWTLAPKQDEASAPLATQET